MAGAVSVPSAPARNAASMIDCCGITTPVCDAATPKGTNNRPIYGENFDEATIERMNHMLHEVEVKFENSLIATQAEWKKKYESYDEIIAKLTKELAESKGNMHQHDEKTDIVQVVDDIEADGGEIEEKSMPCLVDDDLPRNLRLDTDLLRRKDNCITDSDTTNCSSYDQSNQRSSSYEDSTVTMSSIEQVVRKEVHSCMKKALSDRDELIDSLRKEVQRQNQLIIKYENDIASRLREIRFSQMQNELAETTRNDRYVKLYSDLSIDSVGANRQPIEQSSFVNNSKSKHYSQLVVYNCDDSPTQSTRQQCINLIQDESDRLMRTWGSQFDDLTIYVQDILDNQRACIAEVRTSVMDHVDAAINARVEVFNTQHNYILRKNQQQVKAILELRNDQERAFHIIVETLIKVKKKLHDMSETMKEYENLHASSDMDVRTITHESSLETSSKCDQCDCKLKGIHDAIDSLNKELTIVLEDRESIQTLLSATIDLITAKWERNNELWNDQLAGVENRFIKQIEAGQKQIHNLNCHRMEMDTVVAAICKKVVKLSGNSKKTIDEHRIDIVPSTSNTLNEERLDPRCLDYVHFDFIKSKHIDQKKYRMAVIGAQQGHTNRHIEFYDLSLAATESDE